jgi:hypothetical protein
MPQHQIYNMALAWVLLEFSVHPPVHRTGSSRVIYNTHGIVSTHNGSRCGCRNILHVG